MSKYNKSSFQTLVSDEIKNNIASVFKKIDKDGEFEVGFFKSSEKMGLENFIEIMKYMNFRGKQDKINLERVVMLDIVHSTREEPESKRITITGNIKVNKYMEMLHQRKNHIIFSVLNTIEDKGITFMKKIKEKENIVDLNEFNLRFKLADEIKMDKNELSQVDRSQRDNVIFRYKNRLSLIVADDEDKTIRIDLTSTKMSKNINKIERMNPDYELEIEYFSKTGKVNPKSLDVMYDEITKFLKIIQQSNSLITKSEQESVIEKYSDLLNVDKSRMMSLDARNAQSLEIQHVVDKLPNKYAVTDKADGERYFLLIHNMNIYLISINLIVKNTGIVLLEEAKEYNNTVLDGEYIFIPKENRHIFMVFDCLIKGGQDIRNNPIFLERLMHADEVIEKCFVSKKDEYYKAAKYTEKQFDTDKIIKFHEKEIKNFMDSINKAIPNNKESLLIRRKYFIGVQGGKDNEIFKYANLMFEKFVYDKDVDCPYILDGLMFHPLEQKYSTKDSKFVEYKWKPADKNSIDFYITFQRSPQTRKILTLYDDSKGEYIKGKPYQIVNLHVGKRIRGVEQPVLFEPEKDSIKYQAYIFLEKGAVRDEKGNMLQDKTVVEFYYNNDATIPDKFRWVPMRTRYDKTESVRRFGTKHGNYSEIAYKVWRSIRNPFTIGDIKILSDDLTYIKHSNTLRGRVDHSDIVSEMKENAYFQKRTMLGKTMRSFHNFIKSNLIYTMCHYGYEGGRHLSILDYGVGRGADIMKYYYAEATLVVGFDIDLNGIMSPTDGAVSRYNQHKKTHPNFPPMSFIHADGGAPLDPDSQDRALGGTTPKNRELLSKYFSTTPSKRHQFDRINCQFVMHYFLANDVVWNNFLMNVRDYLTPGGYFIASTFDGDRVLEVLGDNNNYTVNYTTQKGEQFVFFDIVKKYGNLKKGDTIGVGNAIGFHNAIDFNEGVYVTEYLVQKDFVEKEFLEKCNMELVETDLFENQHTLQKPFLSGPMNAESVDKTRKFLQEASQFYDSTQDINATTFKLSRLYRYFIFRKKDEETKSKR